MNRYCPRCGEPLEDDGDRIYDDWCNSCGWRTKERELADCVNEASFEYGPHCRMLAQHIYDLQALYDQSCGYSSGQVSWHDTTEGVRLVYVDLAATVLVNRNPELRQRLKELRARKREAAQSIIKVKEEDTTDA